MDLSAIDHGGGIDETRVFGISVFGDCKTMARTRHKNGGRGKSVDEEIKNKKQNRVLFAGGCACVYVCVEGRRVRM